MGGLSPFLWRLDNQGRFLSDPSALAAQILSAVVVRKAPARSVSQMEQVPAVLPSRPIVLDHSHTAPVASQDRF